jgi:uncharacterized membrane protein
MDEQQKRTDLHRVFTLWVLLKALGGLIQVFFAAALMAFRLGTLQQWLAAEAGWVQARGLAWLDLSRAGSGEISSGTQRYAALYLLVHGLSKIVLSICLLKNQRWAYPASMAALLAFVIFQSYQLCLGYSFGLALLTLYDTILMWLIWMEYQAVKKMLPFPGPK